MKKRDAKGLTEEEFLQLTEGAWGLRTRNCAMVLTMLYTGLRIGEITRLRVADLFHGYEPRSLLIVPGSVAKNGKEREVPIPSMARAALTELLRAIRWVSVSDPNSLPAFPSRKKLGEMTVRQGERIVQEAGTKILGRRLHPHQLRHTYATRMLRHSDIRTVQYLLGHADIRSTEIYLYPNTESASRHAESMVPKEIDLSELMRRTKAPSLARRALVGGPGIP